MYTYGPADTTIKSPLARWWLLAGVMALIGSGVPALLLVIARTTGLAEGAAFMRLFHEALVVHVDLSVLVWFLAVACMLWSLEAARCRAFIRIPWLEAAALLSVASGAALIALSPLAGGEALMSNYIPVVTNFVFFFGLSLVLTGILLQVAHVLLCRPRFEEADGLEYAMSYGGYTAALITLVAVAAFVWAYAAMPEVIEGEQFYELLFWAGGHVLQFTHTQMLLIAWLMLAAPLVPGYMLPRRVLSSLFSVGIAAAFCAPLAFIRYDVTSQAFRLFFTDLMIILNGLAPAALMVLIVWKAWMPSRCPLRVARCQSFGERGTGNGEHPRRGHNTLTASLIMSMLVFAYGGVLGLLIQGQDVTIPAHYHGSIVGITLAFMGLAYLLLPRFGWAEVAQSRLAFWQPIVLGIGQILHVTGLAWLGGHGVLRKTPGAEAADMASAAALHVMRFGGLLAVLGGVMFVVVVIRAVVRGAQSSSRLPPAK